MTRHAHRAAAALTATAALAAPAAAGGHYPQGQRARDTAVHHVYVNKCQPVGGCYGGPTFRTGSFIGEHSYAAYIRYRRPGGCYAEARVVVDHYYHVASATYYCV
jgi:hypothetical protein